jgi:hypothetical protein
MFPPEVCVNVLSEVSVLVLTLELKVLISSEIFATQVDSFLVGLGEF